MHQNKETPFHKDRGWCSESKASVTNLPYCLLLIIFIPLGNQGENFRHFIFFIFEQTESSLSVYGSGESQCYYFLLDPNSQRLKVFLFRAILSVLDGVKTKLISALTAELRMERNTITG